LLLVGSIVGLVTATPVAAAPTTWNSGDVFAGVGNGSYHVYDNAGNFKETISDGMGGITTGCAFNPTQDKLYTTNFSSDKVVVYDNNLPHTVLQTITTNPSSNEDVVFAADGSYYVGHADGTHEIQHFNAAGNLLATFAPAIAPGGRGTDWLDLAADQRTMFYASEGGGLIKRFDVASNTQLADFATLPGTLNFALRLLPPGDGTGGLLVAAFGSIKRLNGAGNVVQTYSVPGEGSFFSLSLDPNGTSFWSGGIFSDNFYKFNIATGTVEVGPINSGGSLAGLCLKGELTAAIPQITLTPPTATNPTGSNHTVTATVASGGTGVSGILVTFSITSGPDMGASGTCSADATCHTDTNGHVSFTYLNNGTGGTDTIQACFTDKQGNQHCATAAKAWIVVEQPITAQGATFSATEGLSFSGTVATFTDPDPNATAAEYKATINWGDNTSSAGTISPTSGGNFAVSGTHTYAEEGPYKVTVTITDVDTPSNTATANSTANVADAALTASPACLTTSLLSYNGPTATFTDAASPFGTLTDFTATINWGDGTPVSSGTVTGPNGGPYAVSGSHTYATTGNFTITTTVKDVGGSMATTSCSTLGFSFAPGGGSFVIGDQNAVIGNSVTFWGAQWAKLNSLSGGNAPSSFKGFAENPLTPACGTDWSADPGNSTPPPPGPLPAFMGVIVTSSTSKFGSTISGNTVDIVIVQTNPGYAPNPGHAGTGTVVAVVC